MAENSNYLDDIDSLDLGVVLGYIEDAYGLNLPNDMLEACATIGEVSDLLWQYLPLEVKQGGKCGTLVAFFNLKRWLSNAYPQIDWRPSTRFVSVAGFRYDRLEDAFPGWNLPSRSMETPAWWLATGCALATGILSWPYIAVGGFVLAAIVFGVVAVPLHKYIFRKGRPSVVTLGDAAAYVAAHNLDLMKARGVTLSRKALWQIFEQKLGAPLTREQRFA